MANRIVSVHAGIYGMGIYAIMLPSSGFSVPHCSCEWAVVLGAGPQTRLLTMTLSCTLITFVLGYTPHPGDKSLTQVIWVLRKPTRVFSII